MALLALLVLCTLPAATHGLALSSLQATEWAAERAADRTLAGASGLLDALEADVSRIRQVMQGPRASLLQLDSEPKEVAKPTLHKKGIDASTAVAEMKKIPAGQMAPMLGLLTGMYDNWKEKIGEANKHETEQKKAFEKTISELEAKKLKMKGTKEGTDTYDRIEAYWKRQRSISHRQYHTALKIMHSGMQKFKSVSGAMSDAIKGKKPSSKDLQAIGMAMPDVVFLQVKSLATWAQGVTKDLQVMKRDCPYCAAQCVDKCHTAGKPYVTCLTDCADAGK